MAATGFLSVVATVLAVFGTYYLGKRQADGIRRQDLKKRIIEGIGIQEKQLNELGNLNRKAEFARLNQGSGATAIKDRDEFELNLKTSFLVFQNEIQTLKYVCCDYVYSEINGKIMEIGRIMGGAEKNRNDEIRKILESMYLLVMKL